MSWLVLCLALAVASMAQSQDADVIVIGAGISGIGAARKLKAAGGNVLVLEGRNRKGGRLWSQSVGNGIYDLGGAWIQGTKGNPLSALAQQFKLPLSKPTRYTAAIYWANGTSLDENHIQKWRNLQTDWNDYVDAAQSGDTDIIYTAKNSVQDVWNYYLAYKKFEPSVARTMRQLVHGQVETEYAASLDKLSALYFNGGDSLDGDSVLWQQGYASLIEKLAAGLNIAYYQTVTSIDYINDLVVVKTAANKTFKAPYVICTLPIGVLQSPRAPKFNPPLPAKKSNAIKALGMGLLNKVILVFKEAFWIKKMTSDWFYFVPAANEQPGSYTTFLSLYSELGKPTIVVFLAGDFAWSQENLTDQAILSSSYARLKAMFPDTFQMPISTRISRWGKEPWSYGSYPYIRVGAPRDAFDIMAESVDEKVFFAGDGTLHTYPSTAHGALISGEREAMNILNLSKRRR